jgi:hypothetical protein
LGTRAAARGGGLARGAVSDLWRNTLSGLPSVFGRLVYLTATRSPKSGKYEFHRLAIVYGEAEADQALRRTHLQTFAEWLCLDLGQQKADLDQYLSSCREYDRQQAVRQLLRLELEKSLIPTAATPTEVRLYLSEFALLLGVLAKEFQASRAESAASTSRT